MKIVLSLCRSTLVLALLALTIVPDVHANGMPTPATRPPAATPLETLLTADGTLNLSTGFSGSLDISGWSMALAADGTPHFSRAHTGGSADSAPALKPASLSDDAYWDGRFDYPPGAVGLAVDTLAVNGTDLYVGGFFTTTGSLSVNNVARWNPGNGWSALGNGVDGIIFALAVSGSTVYAGGSFTQVCGNSACKIGNTTANHVAVWNGSSWSALGNGVSGNVDALAVSGSTVYAGGLFSQACGNSACNSGNTTVNDIAQWNGSSWSALANGVSGIVRAFAVSGSTVYVGGSFGEACGNSACNSGNSIVNFIAQWNGSSWSPLGNGLSNEVHALAVDGSTVYAGGFFFFVCGDPACSSGNTRVNLIAAWNGSSWTALGNGVNNSVSALAVSGSTLVAGGQFTQLCGNAACNGGNTAVNRTAQWNGSNWSAVGNGVSSAVVALALSGSALYAGGDFSQLCGNATCDSGNITAPNIALWDGSASAWSPLGNGANGDVFALAVSGGNVYAGGAFTSIGGVAANRVAVWNGSHWAALGSGINGNVYALVVSGVDVFAGGDFIQVCGIAACNMFNRTVNRVAEWNGSSWSALGSGVDNIVAALAVSGGSVYAGGYFIQVCGNAACNSGNTTANYIAAWNGSSWSAVGNGLNSQVNALALSGSTLVAGGLFTQLCGNATCDSGNAAANRIAEWNGSSWSALGNGVNGTNAEVVALLVSGSTVFAGGQFTEVCGNPGCTLGNASANNVAQWNGSSWSALGNGLDGPVGSFGMIGGTLYASGVFTEACGNPGCSSGNTIVNHVAAWNGSSWSALGSGTNDIVEALAADGSNLYIGGLFAAAGGKPSFHFARWNKSFLIYLPLIEK
jgi:trimeric autotransporter adhesin